MKPRQLVYVLRPDEERAAFEWWLDRRSAPWSVVLHTVRCAGDDRDAELMFRCQEARYRMFPVDLPPLRMIGANGTLDCGGAMWDADPVWRHRHST